MDWNDEPTTLLDLISAFFWSFVDVSILLLIVGGVLCWLRRNNKIKTEVIETWSLLKIVDIFWSMIFYNERAKSYRTTPKRVVVSQPVQGSFPKPSPVAVGARPLQSPQSKPVKK